MNVGDLVINIYTQEIGLIISFQEFETDYVSVICKHKEWLVPIEHLEVINETR